jgi:hypothetical protein
MFAGEDSTSLVGRKHVFVISALRDDTARAGCAKGVKSEFLSLFCTANTEVG